MKYFFVFLLLLAPSAFACWKVEGTLGVDGETFKIHQKVDHDKDYSLPMGSFIFNFKLKTQKKGEQTLQYSLYEKKGAGQVLVTKGEDDIKQDATKEIFSKGEEGQPNSIITLKLMDI